jgi:hypothetical protein
MKFLFISALTGLLLAIPGCKKENPLSIQTLPVTNIDVATATSGGSIISDGGSTIIDCGICWSRSENFNLNTGILPTLVQQMNLVLMLCQAERGFTIITTGIK